MIFEALRMRLAAFQSIAFFRVTFVAQCLKIVIGGFAAFCDRDDVVYLKRSISSRDAAFAAHIAVSFIYSEPHFVGNFPSFDSANRIPNLAVTIKISAFVI